MQKLQLKAPVICLSDSRDVQGLVLSGEVFHAFEEEEYHMAFNVVQVQHPIARFGTTAIPGPSRAGYCVFSTLRDDLSLHFCLRMGLQLSNSC